MNLKAHKPQHAHTATRVSRLKAALGRARRWMLPSASSLSIAAARRTLYITNSYFAPESQLHRLARGRGTAWGVDVRFLAAGPRTDVNVVRSAGRAWYETLLGSG